MLKVRELQPEKASTLEQMQYRDRARERRKHFGYDPGIDYVYNKFTCF